MTAVEVLNNPIAQVLAGLAMVVTAIASLAATLVSRRNGRKIDANVGTANGKGNTIEMLERIDARTDEIHRHTNNIDTRFTRFEVTADEQISALTVGAQQDRRRSAEQIDALAKRLDRIEARHQLDS